MMDNNMNRKNSISNTGAQGTRSRNAASGNCPGAATRRAVKVTPGGSANTHSRRGIFGALLSVLMAAIMISSFALGAFADDLANTVPGDEDYDTTGTVTTAMPGPGGNSSHPGIDRGNSTTHQTTKVRQSQSTTSATTFASGAPLSTIYIDQARINKPGSDNPQAYIESGGSNITYKLLASDPRFAPGIEYNADNASVNYNPNKTSGLTQLVPGSPLVMNGPLYELTFKNAAIMPDGTRMHLRVTFSDAVIYTDERLKSTNMSPMRYDGSAYLSIGANFRYGGTDNRSLRTYTSVTEGQPVYIVNETAKQYGSTFDKDASTTGGARSLALGQRMNATYQVVNDNGIPVEGSFILAFAGINIDRDPYTGGGNNTAKPLWYVNANNPELDFFSESIGVNTAGLASDYIYVRSNNNNLDDTNTVATETKKTYYYPIITETGGVVKITANQDGTGSKDNASYSTGFITVADSGKGITLTGYGHGAQHGSMQTSPFASTTLWYRYISSTGDHGNIQTTSEGNHMGTLSDGGEKLGPGTYVVTEGKTVTYTMTPDIGYKISKLEINGTPITFSNGSLQNIDISQMKRGDTVTVETADASKWPGDDKGKGTLTYNEDGTYTFKFNHATADEKIHVEWEPTTADILTYKIWDDDNDKDGIRYNADTNNTLPKFKLQYSLNGRTWTDVKNTVNIGNQTYTLKKPVTEQTVPAGKDNNNKYVDGEYVINNDPNKNSIDPKVNKHPFTWEHLPVYTYDSNGVAGKAIQYRVVEVADPWHSEYKDAEYYDLEVFDLTSDKVKSIDGWSISTDGTKHYVQKADGKYYEVDINDGSVADSPATNQPDPDNLYPYANSDSWTIDKAIPYQESQVKNTHFTTEYFVEVTKKWDDTALLGLQTTSETNQYQRKNIYIVLHGETENGDVDLNGSESGTDLKKEIKTTELEAKANVTGNKTIDNYTLYENGTNQYALVEGDATYADGYYTVSGNAIDYTSGPLDPAPTGLTVVKKGDGTYNINANDFGAMFEDLPTHYNGKEITYTVKETDTNGAALSEWIMTGGELSPVTDNDKNVLGYETTMRNTPDVDEIYNKLPLTIVKQDINSKGKLEGAEFTIYTDAVVGDKASQSETKKVGEKVYSKTEHDEATNTDITKNYVIRKDANDGDKYKYFEVTANGTVSTTPAKPQPVSLDLTDNGVLGGGEDGYTDGTNTYVKRSGSYHLVNADGSVAAAPANPQPDANLIKAAKDETTGAVKENVVTTNAAGEAYVSFLKTGTYYIKETKAPEGYNVDPTTYAFKVDAELKSITLESVNGEHTTPWWKKLYDLIFGNSGASYDNWTPNTDKKGGTLTVDDTPIVANVLVRKYWNDNDNQDGKRPGDKINPSSTDDSRLDPEFKLPTVTLQYTIGAHTATGLNVYTDSDPTDPKKYVLKNNQYYEVTAEDVTGTHEVSAATTQPASTTATSETCKGLTVYTDSSNKKYVLIDNAYYEVNSVDTEGSVAASPAAEQPDENLLSLVMDGGWTTVQVKDDNDNLIDAKDKVNYVGGPVLTHQNDAYTWTDLPAYRDGKLVTYRILEEDDPAGNILRNHIYDIESNHTSQTHDKTFHLANTSGAKPTALNQTVDVTNRHDPQVINIEAYKKWEDEDPDDRSASTIRLYKVVNGIETVVSTGSGDTTQEDKGTVPVEDTTEAIKVWKDLPTYEGGNPVTYRLKEESIEGYNTHYSAKYTKTDGNPIDTESQDILAEDVKRTFYAQGDTLPEGKKVGDENTTAKFEILNERSVNVKVSKTWRNGANANVTYELWRTIKKENELTSSKFTSTPVSDADSNRYYIHKITKAIITAETYEQMAAEDKANYDIETVRTWSPYAGGGKDGDPSDAVDGWKLVSTHLFDSNDFENVATGKTVEYAFNSLDIKDINGNEYLYRVLEKPALNRFRENQISNTEIINNNVNVSDGNVSLEVVKELEGRSWMDKDDFKFYLEAVNGKNVTDPANPVDVAQNMVPMPYRIDPATSKTTYNYTADATKTDLQVGALGRAATFQGIQYKQNSNLYQSIGVGETYEFYYKVYEIYDTKTEQDTANNSETITKDTELDTATVHTGKKNGITYDGKTEGGEFKPTVHEAKVIVKNSNGIISTETQWKKADGQYATGTNPVFTNTYSSEGTAKIWVEKEIKNRAWVDYNNSAKTGDAFEFKIDSISGSQLNVPGSTTSDSYTTKPLMSNATNNPQSDIQKMSDTEYAFGMNGNKYDNTMLNSNGVGYFIYEISEDGKINSYSDDHFNIKDYTVDGLNYDPNKKYVKLKAKDNWDGTISFTIEYFTDASCKENYKINDYKAWIYDDGTQTNEGKHLLSMTEAAQAEGMTQDQRDEAGFRKVDVAHFTNYENIDIPVKKEWTDGPAIEDVNLHLERHLFPISGTGAVNDSAINDSYVKTEEAKDVWTEDNPFWQTAGYTHISKRGEFLKDDGTPKYNDGENKSSQTYGDKKNEAGEDIAKEDFIDGFNENLPKYIVGDGKNGTTSGVVYRVVYRLYEDDTSNTYTRTYKSINNGTETEGDYIFTDGDTLVVTNKVVASNKANPAAVKQLQGRDWLTGDDFKFTLTPVGKYDKDGTYVETTDIPKPAVITGYVNKEDDTDTKTVEEYEALSDEAKASYEAVKETSNEAHAKKDDKVVDPNGNLERLARFGEIAFKTSDLVYHTSDKHYHGDFFYEMKEDIPATAYAVNKKTGEKVLDGDNEINFDSNFTKAQREQYHWKDDDTGITYDGSVHTVHVKVKENRTNELQVQVAYDEETRGDITTGTQFTPVYTNKYDATVEYAQTIDKYIRGRDWKDSDVFDFRMTPLAGAPFEDADRSEFPAQDTHSDDDRETDLEKGDAIHSARGAHVRRLDVSETTKDIQTLTMPKLEFRLSELGKTVTAENPLYYSDKTTAVPVGMAYDQFVYSFEETNDYLSKADKDVKDLIIDPDTEYARVTVIDKGDGTLDYYTEIFEDRYCKIPRYEPGTEIIDSETGEIKGGEPAENPTFVNKLKRNLSITKTWVGTATSDVTLRLQWSVNGTNYYNVDEAEWMPAGIRNTQTIGRHDSGTSLTKTWYNLPAYANITDALDQEGDNLDMNDLWVYYRIVEDDIPNVITRYSTAPYVVNDDYNNADKYKTKNDAPHTGAEKEEGEYVTNRVTQLYVTNWPKDLTGEAKVGIVKQYIGKAWEGEEFEFEIIPIESQIGGETTPVKEGATRKTTVYSKTEGGVETVISKGEYDAITDADEKAKYQAKEVSETNSLPKYNSTNGNKAIARKGSEKVSVNERSANFNPLTIKLSDLAIDYTGDAKTNPDYGKAKGTFYYKIREVRPPDAEETSEVCGKDADGKNVNYVVGTNNGKKVKYTTEEHVVKIVAVDDGSGSIDVTTSFDNREHGEFVPVYTNYALMETPVEGEKMWVGGEKKYHQNGTVKLKNNDTEIDSSEPPTDELGLKLQRKLGDGEFTTIDTDDAGRPLIIVWVKEERNEETTTTYVMTDDDSVVPGKTYYTDGTGTTAVIPEGTENPSESGWYEKEETTTYTFNYAKQEGEASDATGKGSSGPYTYTIKAIKTETDSETGVTTTSYVDPYLNTVDKDGNEYTYQIDETDVPDNYKVSRSETDGLKVTNTYKVKDDIKVTKTWDDAKNVAGLRPDSVTVHLYKVVNEVTLTDREKTRARESVDKSEYDENGDGEVDPDKQDAYEGAQDAAEAAALAKKQAEEGEIQVEVARKEIKPATGEKDEWTTGITWEDLPVYDPNGNVIKYVVLEEGVAGYTPTYAVDSKDAAEYKEVGDTALEIELDGDTKADPQFVDIKNSLTPATNTVKVTKVWDDQNDIDGARPDDVTFQLYKYVWDPDANSGKGAYKTTEEPVSGENGKGRPATQADVDADKAAKGDASTMKVGDIIKIEDLVLDGTAETDTDGSTPSTDDDVDTQANETARTDDKTWNGEWINLPLTENGKTILYIIKEVIPAGADSAYGEPGTQGKYSNDPCIRGDQIKGYTATNTYTPEVTSFEGIKEWVDGDSSIKHNNSAELPGNLTLWRTNVAPDQWTDETAWTNLGTLDKLNATLVPDAHVDWSSSNILTIFKPDDKFTITGLPKKDGEGKTYYYKVTETPIDGYDQTYDNSDLEDEDLNTRTDAIYDGGTVENAAKVGDVEITKKFVDKDGNVIPKATLPSGFKIMVSYVWNNPETKKYEKKTEPLTITDDTPVTDGVYKWTLSNVVAGTKVTAEESGYDSPTGYSYVSSTATVNGDNDATHLEENPTYAEFTMPIAAANKNPTLKAYNPGEGGDAPASVAFVNTYKRNTGGIKPIKIWDDDSDAAGERPDEVTFTITATDNGDLSKTYPVIDNGSGTKVASIDYKMTKDKNSGDTWFINESDALRIDNLPTHADDGKQICYVVTENNVPEGYQRLYPQASGEYIFIRLAKDGDYQTAEITNAYAEFEITKQWRDADGDKSTHTTIRPTAADFKEMLKLYAGSQDVTETYKNGLTVTPNDDGTYTAKWTGLRKRVGNDINSAEIVYSAKESPETITGYAKGTYSDDDRALKDGTITNTQLIKVDVVKQWDDKSNHEGRRPDEIKVKLFRNGLPLGDDVTLKKGKAPSGGTYEESADGNTYTWTGVWPNLFYADEYGVKYNYTAVEIDSGATWYQALIGTEPMHQILLSAWKDENTKDTWVFTIDNKYDDETTGFTVDKIWNDGSDVDKLRPEKIYYRLYQDYEGISDANKQIKTLPTNTTVTITGGEFKTANNGYIEVDTNKTDVTQGTLGRVTIEGLPKYSSTGKLITYSIKEDADVSTSATTTDTPPEKIFGYTTTVDGDSSGGGVTVTNSHNTPSEVEVSPKAVKEITGRTFKLGEEFTFKLAVDENSPENTPTPTPDWVTIKAGATEALGKTMDIPLGTFKFTGADMLGADGKPVNEKTFIYNLTEVNGGKTYDDLYYDPSTLTLSITVKRNVDTAELEIADTDVKWGENNTDAEKTFVNEHGATKKLTLRKVWVDVDADGTVIGERPTSVEFKVTATIKDGWSVEADDELKNAGFTKKDATTYEKTYEIKSTDKASEDTDHTWQIETGDLPKYDAEGTAIKYEVSEEQAPPNYNEPKLVVKNDVYTITNEYKRDEFTGTKVWVDGGKKHDNVTELTDKLTVQRTTTPDDETSWTSLPKTGDDAPHIHWNKDGAKAGGKYTQSFTIMGLPEKDAERNAYTYRVIEGDVTGIDADYKTTYDNAASTDGNHKTDTDAIYDGGKVINKLEDKNEITAEKKWVSGDPAEHVNNKISSVDLYRESESNGGSVGKTKVDGVVIGGFDPATGDSEFTFGTVEGGVFTPKPLDEYDADGFKYVYTIENEVLDDSIADKYEDTYEGLTVTNTFVPVPAKITPEFIKRIQDKPDDVASKAFTFLLAPQTNTAAIATDDLDKETPVTVSANGDDGQVTFDFGEFTFTEEGTYKYKLVEKAEDGWVVADPSKAVTEFSIEVENQDGTLVAEIIWPKGADVVTDADDENIKRLRITNEYDPEAVASALDVEKTLTGRNLKAEEFNFSMTGLNKQQAGTGYEDASGKEAVGTNRRAADGTAAKVDMSAVSFDHEGKYMFGVSEVIPAKNDKLPGIKYDTNKYRAVATVTGDDKGVLSVAWKIVAKSTDGGTTWTEIPEGQQTDKASFTNEYDGSIESPVLIKKILEDRVLKENEFEFVLAGDTTADGTDNTIQTVGNGAGSAMDADKKSEGTAAFDALKFTPEDFCDHDGGYIGKQTDGSYKRTFNYKVYEKPDNKNGITYDANDHDLEATLVWTPSDDNDHGTLTVTWKLDEKSVEFKPDDLENSDFVEFNNIYDPDAITSSPTDGGGATVPEGTVDVTKYLEVPAGQERSMIKDEFLFEIIDSKGNRVALGTNIEDGQDVAGDRNDSQSPVSIAPITFTKKMGDDAGWHEDPEGKETGIEGASYAELTYTIKEIVGNNTKGEDRLEYDEHTATVKALLIDDDGKLKVKWVLPKGQDTVFKNKAPVETIDKPVRVSWVNDTDADYTVGTDRDNNSINVAKDRPEEVTVTLQAEQDVYSYDGKDYTTFADLMAAMPEGTTEDQVREAIDKETEIGGKTITTATKWVDVTKKADGTTVPSSITLDKTKNLDGDPNNWGDTETWTGLPKYDENGKPIEYRIIQSGYKLPDGTEVEPTKAKHDGETGADGEMVAEGSTLPANPNGYVSSGFQSSIGGVLTTIVNKMNTTTIEGTKKWIEPDPDHNNSSDITFTVERSEKANPGDGDWTELTNTDYHVDWSGAKDKTFTIRGLTQYVDGNAQTPYTYRVTENKVPGYTTKYFDADGDETDNLVDGGVVKNIIEQDYVKIHVTKKWVGEATDDVTFTLKADGKNLATETKHVFETGDFDSADSADFTFEKDGVDNTGANKLPKYKFDGDDCTVIDYTIVETPDGTADGSKFTSSDVSGEGTANKPYVITNTRNDAGKTNIPVMKKWDDSKNQEGIRPASVKARVQAKDGDTWTDVWVKNGELVAADTTGATKVDDITLNDENNWKKLFKNLPATTTDGTEITYRVVELDSDGQTVRKDGDMAFDGKYTVSITGDQEDGFIIKNTYKPGTIKVKVIKQWVGDADVKADTRKDVTLHLIGRTDENKEAAIAFDGGEKTIDVQTDPEDNEDAGDVTWTGLPKKMDGKTLVWEVYEDAVPGYVMTGGDKATVDADGNAEFTVTNTYTGPVNKVEAKKVWVDDDNRDGIRTAVYLQLFRKVGDGDEEPVGEPKIATADSGSYEPLNKVEWTKLPVVLTETKTETKDSYVEVEPTPTVGDPVGDDWYVEDGEDYAEATGNVEENVTYYQKVTETTETTIDRAVVYWVKEVEIVDGEWVEKAPDGYTCTVVQTEPGKFEATNTHVPEKVYVKVNKIWNDNNDSEGVRPDHVTFRLKADGAKVKDHVIRRGDDGWVENTFYTFDALPKYDDGDEIEYSIVELDEPKSGSNRELDGTSGKDAFTDVAYTVTFTDMEGEGTQSDPYSVTATNTYNSSSLIKLTAHKVWDGDDDSKNRRSDVTLRLIRVNADGKRTDMGDDYEKTIDVDSAIAAGENAGDATWDNLSSKVKGEEVSYTVEEKPVPSGYTSIVGSVTEVPDKENEYEVTVTNTAGEVPWRADVIYIDPLNKNAAQGQAGDGKMIVQSTKYKTPEEALEAAKNKTGKPADPKHSGKKFLGWTLNWDENDNYVLVATYADIPKKPTPTVSYVDPQTGKVIISKQTKDPSSIKPPAAPKHKGLQFLGWVKMTDSAGNTIFAPKYAPDCANGGGGNGNGSGSGGSKYSGQGDPPDRSARTGDEADIFLWVLLIITSILVMATLYKLRRREENL